MKTLLKLILVALTLQFVACSTPEITISRSTGEQVEIFPDYKDIIIPCNIAPMNFTGIPPTLAGMDTALPSPT